MEEKGSQIAKLTLIKSNKKYNFALPDMKIHYKTTEIKTALFWYKNRHTE